MHSLGFLVSESNIDTDGKSRKIEDVTTAEEKLRLSNHDSDSLQTETERLMKILWAQVLKVNPDSISTNDHFFGIGGNATKSLQLCRLALGRELYLTARDVFQHPRFGELSVKARDSTAPSAILAFSLLDPKIDVEDVRSYVGRSCHVQESQVLDILPCTPLQEGFLALAARQTGDYVETNILEIPPETNIDKFCKAWDQVVAMNPILRTRFVSLPAHGILQVVLEEGISWTFDTELEEYQREHTCKGPVMGLATPLTSFAILKGTEEHRYFVCEIHHALYDGWSMELLFKQAEHIYHNQPIQALHSIHALIRYIRDIDEVAARAFWKAQFVDIQGSHFPSPRTSYYPRPDCQIGLTVSGLQRCHGDFTVATTIKAAWAVVMAHSSGSKEALFGVVVSGRNAPIAGIESVAGPAIATVPVRVNLDWDSSVISLIDAVQHQATDMIPFEQTGLQRIRCVSEAAAIACNFQTLLVVQPANKIDTSSGLFLCAPSETRNDAQLDHFSTYPIVIECQLTPDEAHVCIGFDSSIVGKTQMEHIAQNFKNLLGSFSAPTCRNKQLGVVASEILVPWGLEDIWTWNAVVPAPTESCVHDLITKQVRMRLDGPAIHAWDGHLTYRQLDDLSTSLAHELVHKGVAGTLVPLIFEKSMWMPVTTLAVMKAGGACVALDPHQPEERLQVIAAQANSPVTLSSVQYSSLARHLAQKLDSKETIVIGPDYQTSMVFSDAKLPSVKPTDVLYVVFTSGSTGTPKGVVISHQNFCSAITHQQELFGYSCGSRILDFTSYAFDVAWCNLLQALTSGGCLCIPAASERENDLTGCLERYKISTLDVTPSIARSLSRNALSMLSTLIVGGEVVRPNDVELARDKTRVFNAYGPAECTPTSVFFNMNPANAITGTGTGAGTRIGRGAGICTWVVNSEQPEMLAPVRAVGELWLEGPLVGSGYLNDPEKTTASFPEDPAWLIRGTLARPGRSGRLFRTGDLVRYDDDGALIFIGRKDTDTQVKIRGQRVELSEVEHNVREAIEAISIEEGKTCHGANPNVNVQVAAEIIQPKGMDSTILVAFVTLSGYENIIRPENKNEDPHSLAVQQVTQGLRERLTNTLPSYMVPTAFVPLTKVPITAAGKTDRRQLRVIGASVWSLYRERSDNHEPLEPLTEVEKVLQQVWMLVLNLSIEETSVNKSFMRMGGDSITAMQVVAHCRLRNIAITVSDVLQAGTIRKLAAKSRTLSRYPPITERDHNQLQEEEDTNTTKMFDLSPIQKWFFDVYPDGLSHFNQTWVLELRKQIPSTTLITAIRALISRHSMLRARFQRNTDRGIWEQMVADDGIEAFAFAEHWVARPEEVSQAAQWRQEHLDIREGPVFASDLFNIPRDRQIIVFTAHHLVIDLVSWRIIWNDLEEYVTSGKFQSPNPVSFRKWCGHQAKIGRNLSPLSVLPFSIPESQLSFWDSSLCDNRLTNSKIYIEDFDYAVSQAVLVDSNECLRTEPVDVLLGTIVHSFLQTFPERPPPAVWIEGHGREQYDDQLLDLSGTVGWFTTLHPLSIPIGLDSSVIDAIKYAKDVRRKVAHQGQLFFACRYYNESGREAFQGHDFVELTFNFTGRFQQLERQEGLFEQADRGEEFHGLAEVSGSVQQPSMIEINADVNEGLLSVAFQVHEGMAHQDRLRQWPQTFAQNLRSAAQDLLRAPASFTLTDLPLLPISYSGLNTLLGRQLPRMGIKPDAIADIYPCSPLQEGILLSSEKGVASYGTYLVWRCVLSNEAIIDFSSDRLEAAWQRVVSRHTILSTVFTLHPEGNGFIQIVIPGSSVRVRHITALSDSPTTILNNLERPTFAPSEPEHAFTICRSRTGEVACRLDVSHALIDAASISVLVDEITAAYNDCDMPRAPLFSEMIAYLNSIPRAPGIALWTALLDGVRPCEFPASCPRALMGQGARENHVDVSAPADLVRGIADFCKSMVISRSTFFQVAWAMVLSHFTGMHGVCFGYLNSSRDAPIDGIEIMVGPLTSMLVSHLDLRAPARQVLETTSEKSIKRLSIQHISLAEIQHKLDLRGRRLFNTVLSIQEATNAPQQGRLLFEPYYSEDQVEDDMSLRVLIHDDIMNIAIDFREPYISPNIAQEACTVFTRAVNYLLTADTEHPLKRVRADIRENGANFDDGLTSQSLFSGFLEALVGIGELSVSRFWQSQFSNIQGSHFPLQRTASNYPRPNREIELSMKGLQWSQGKFTAATMIKAAWSVVSAGFTDSNEALFGATVNDCQTIVPIRVVLNWEGSTFELLQGVQRQAIEMKPFLQTGLQRIRRVSDEAALACDFQTLLHIFSHPGTMLEGDHSVISMSEKGEEGHKFDIYAILLECQVQAEGAIICMKFDSDIVGEVQVVRIGHQFEHVLRQLFSSISAEMKLLDVTRVSQRDLNDIWTWNSTVPEPVEACVHDLIIKRTSEKPSALAIQAWDGDLTYSELHELSSCLAYKLAEKGLGPGKIVLLCFEKSMWMPVAAIAVMKTGGASAALDTATQPESRLRAIAIQVNAMIILSSVANEGLSRRLGAQEVVVVGPAQLSYPISERHQQSQGCNLEPYPELSPVRPSDALYVVFTSGSTGKPKGAIITHQNFCSAVVYQRDALGFMKDSRVLDFASYAFDASWSNLINTLTAGGCLCVPSAAERENDISGCLKRYNVTLSDFTPSFARHIKPKSGLSNLSTLMLAGEAVLPTDAHLAGNQTQILNVYGPAECTPTSTILDLSGVQGAVGIGRGVGLCTWIVDIDDPTELVAVGAVGELWLEGPLVGQGYIKSPENTAAVFVQDPVWLVRGAPDGRRGRRGRLYRTGDLVQYQEDGSLLFIGRKDTQVKIRGQRVELEEIEYHVRQAIETAGVFENVQIVAETIQPRGTENIVLVAFVALSYDEGTMDENDYSGTVGRATVGLNDVLAEWMPPYMIPTVYIPIRRIPIMAAGKVDRRQLHTLGSSLTSQDIAALSRPDNRLLAPQSEMEKLMQDLWAEVLDISPNSISIADHFFRIGGDSIGAMRLVGLAQQKGISLSVRDIFRTPILRDLSVLVGPSSTSRLAH